MTKSVMIIIVLFTIIVNFTGCSTLSSEEYNHAASDGCSVATCDDTREI